MSNGPVPLSVAPMTRGPMPDVGAAPQKNPWTWGQDAGGFHDDGQGYQALSPGLAQASNPYQMNVDSATAQMNQDSQAALGLGQSAWQNMANLQSQAPKQYPTFPNQAGVGTQQAYTPQAQAPVSPASPAQGLGSSSPWTFSGDSNARR